MRATMVALRTKNLENKYQESTPSHQQPPRPLLRSPLQSRNQNAMLRGTPLTTKSGNAANSMPTYDKQSRPLMPPLSATAKTSTRTPLTPRVAGSAAPALTPLPRRTARPDANFNAQPVNSPREDLSTPVSTFLGTNVTPRSGSRKSRVDSTNTTPSGTPTATANTNETFRVVGDAPLYGSGLTMVGLDKDGPKRATVSFSPAISDIGQSRAPQQSADSKFFFASEAKSTQAPKLQPQTKSTSTFFYANGDSIPTNPQSSGTSIVGSSIGEDRGHQKFFHANGTPDLSPSPLLAPSRPSSIVSTNSRISTPRLANGNSGTLSPPPRPLSPLKNSQPASLSSLRGSPSLPSPSVARPQVQGRGQSAINFGTGRGQSYENDQRVGSHSRSASLDSPPPKQISNRVSSGSSFESSSSATPLKVVPNSLTLFTSDDIVEGVEPAEETSLGPLSPTKTGQSMEHLNELAANARRERKVLDLEITNSSLAAINRTLEREMRKQTAELRRYRRLSRSGRLSIATSVSKRSSSGNLSILEEVEGTDLSDISDGDFDPESEEEESEDDSLDDGSLSPAALAESDLRHRKKDEQRLQLDLSKHQQLLIDSQKMNQSLKRCLGWTEELIKEGKKALEYQVRVSDVELGGRVLIPDEVEDLDNEGLGLIGSPISKEARLAAVNTAVASWDEEGRDDRDSGIEVDSQRERVEDVLLQSPR